MIVRHNNVLYVHFGADNAFRRSLPTFVYRGDLRAGKLSDASQEAQ
jgi:hypothetical protein